MTGLPHSRKIRSPPSRKEREKGGAASFVALRTRTNPPLGSQTAGTEKTEILRPAQAELERGILLIPNGSN